MNAKNLYARPNDLQTIKNDNDFMQFLAEMFTSEGGSETEKPENVKLVIRFNRVEVFIKDYISYEKETSIGYIVKCNICGNFDLDVHSSDTIYQTRYCPECKEEFKQILGDKNIEW